MYVSLFNLSILWNLSQNRHSIVLELVHIIEANSNYAYVYRDKKWAVLYCMCVCMCVCVCVFGIIQNATFCNMPS